ncbi:flagellar hook-basal body complex protein FliE [Novispirillum sp. DQ9]|uniref:flagellar hook-basal body complex protein FliE n=1 Tax=Novispirillum sp. DQ9 TaxID=3398612 RepID=UPI003C7C5297
MVASINNAISAYQSAARSALGQAPAAAPSVGGAQPEGESFADLVSGSLKKAVALGHRSEEMSLKGVAGEADLTDVVLAVNNAENALNTVVAVRDKVINAYQEIMRMPI